MISEYSELIPVEKREESVDSKSDCQEFFFYTSSVFLFDNDFDI